MTAPWSLDDFAAAAGGSVEGNPPKEIGGLSIDSRTIGPGEAFVAIRGEKRDGHEFVAAALRAGAALAVVQEGRLAAPATPLLVVPDDPLAALQRLAAAARERMAGRVVAVTGSVGKTGSKEMLRLVLSASGPTHTSPSSFNNQWGVPLSLAGMPADAAYGVFEIGMNHAGEIRPLARLVRPHVALVTTVEPVHIAFFGGEAEIADAKAEIFEGLADGGTAILNRDNRWFDRLAARAAEQGAGVVSFGERDDCDVRLMRVALHEDGSSVQVSLFGTPVTYRVGAPGRHLVQNSLGVLAACQALGGDMALAVLALAAFRAPPGRGERHRLHRAGGALTLIDESYNANPASMRAALDLLAQTRPGARGRRIAVLGDMLELGGEGTRHHLALAEAVEASQADLVFLAGAEMRALWQALPEARRAAYAEHATELAPILIETIGPGDVVMVKASLGTGLGPVVDAIRRRFAAPAE